VRRNDEVEAQRRRWTFYETINSELLANVTYSVIPAKAGIQKCLKILDSGSRFACPDDFPLLSRVLQEALMIS
jgi:hypothetical protein